MVGFLKESTNDFQVTETVGGFENASSKQSFDEIFKEAANNLATKEIDIMTDINDVIKNKAVLASFKDALLGTIATECTDMVAKESEDSNVNYGTHKFDYDQLSKMFDACTEDLIKESTKVGQLLPIKAVDYPVLIKQQLKLATRDIMQTEVTPTPIIKKHIEQTYIVDNTTKERFKYPQVFFTDEWKKIYAAGKGLPIKDTPVEIPVYEYDIVSNLTDAEDPTLEVFTFDLQIPVVVVDGVDVTLARPMRINLSDGQILGGKIKKTVKKDDGSTLEVDDLVTGAVDFVSHTVSLSSAKGQVTAVKFAGYLSNEKNQRTVTFDYDREEIEWKIEDGVKADCAYTLEQLEDTKALMDIDLYQKTYNNMGDFLTQLEDSQVLDWLDEQFEKYKGVEIPEEEILSWSPFVTVETFDCDSTTLTTALPVEFIEKQLKFKVDRLINDVADRAKLEDITFVIYGNPRIISLLDPVVNWVTRPGSTSNGVKLDYGYGIMTSGDVKVQVVSTKKVNIKYDSDEKTFSGLRLIPYPLNKEQMTFKHYKYTSHILTSQNSAYRPNSKEYPNGSYTYLLATSRYTNVCVQGIQAQLKIASAEPYIATV